MTLAEWAIAGARLVGEVERSLRLACKPMKAERLRRFGETRLQSNEWAMEELRLSLHPDVIADLAGRTRAQLAPQFQAAAALGVEADVEEAIVWAFRYMVQDCLAAARARIRRAAKAAEREECRRAIPAFLAAYEVLLAAEDERLLAASVDLNDEAGFLQLMEERRARMADADAEVERLGIEPEVLELHLRRMEAMVERSKEQEARRAEATRAIKASRMTYRPR